VGQWARLNILRASLLNAAAVLDLPNPRGISFFGIRAKLL
jgi:hypothetical protein